MRKKFREISLYVKINFILCDNYSHKSLIISIEEFHFMRKPTMLVGLRISCYFMRISCYKIAHKLQ
jgi:hypothetical protein